MTEKGGLMAPVASILIWYFFNTVTVISNKYLFQMLHFNYPILLTAVHMLVCSICGYLSIHVFGLFEKKTVTWDAYKKRILPLAFIFCFNIVLGNVGLRYIPVSFMQTVKSAVPAVTVFIQVFILDVKMTKKVYGSVALVVGGVALASITEVNFQMVGFLCSLFACVSTASQAIISEKLIAGEFRLDAINMVLYTSPASFVMLIPLTLGELGTMFREWPYAYTSQGFTWLLLSGLVAFLLNVSTFFAYAKTSALTMTVAGNFKVVLIIIISVAIFQNEVTVLNALGCVVTVIGVYAYNFIKYQERSQKMQVNK